MSDDGLGAVSQTDRELYNRVTNGNAAEVKDCLSRGANVDVLDDVRTALHCPALHRTRLPPAFLTQRMVSLFCVTPPPIT